MKMRLTILGAALAAALVLFAACNDDDGPAGPELFQVVLEVTDPDGAPVAGLELGLAPDTPFYMDGKVSSEVVSDSEPGLDLPYPVPFNPSVMIKFTTAQQGTVSVVIEDVAGDPVRHLYREDQQAGLRTIMWNGQDDDQATAPAGVYFAHLTQIEAESGNTLLDERRPMLMANFYANQALVGTTDAEGRIVLSDERLFPYLFDVDPFPATDENGLTIGTITLTPAMRFYFTDPGSNRTVRYNGQVTGSTILQFVWDPQGG